MCREQRRRQGGFTLVEIMVVVVILGLLATMVVQNVVGYSDEARVEKAKHDVQAIAEGMKLYVVKNGSLPADGLEALVRKDEKGNCYIEVLPKDPWDNDYILVPGERGKQFSIISMGPDKTQDTDDDIAYPPPENRR